MTEEALQELIGKIRKQRCETNVLELKTAHQGCPRKLYDTLSSFSNQAEGGTIVFGIDEENGYALMGVYDPQDLQKKVAEQANEMTPEVRPVFTTCLMEGMTFVAAEIPPMDVAERPCFHTPKGRLSGSYTRVGDSDKRMTEYEVYSYEAFRRKLHDDVRAVEDGCSADVDIKLVEHYLDLRKRNRPNLAELPQKNLCTMTGIEDADGNPTLLSLLLFGIYPQALYPQLCVLATAQGGEEVDAPVGERFADTKRIEGTLPEILEGAMAFIRNNMRTAIRFNEETAEREDVPQYPLIAVREALLNALIHRDYSRYTESMPICLRMYRDKLVITNPGGLYGRVTVDELGSVRPDTRNQYIAVAMEALGETENRYSGIPCIRRAMAKAGLPAPVFESVRGEFRVTLNSKPEVVPNLEPVVQENANGLLAFCTKPRTKREIAAFLKISSVGYATQKYIAPLLQAGMLRMTIPDSPRSHSQRYVTVQG